MIIFRVTIGRSWLKSPSVQKNGGNGELGPIPVADVEISKPIDFAHSVSRGQTAEVAVTTTYSSFEESSQRSSTAEDFPGEQSGDDMKLTEKSGL